MIGRADIEGSKSNVAMNAWLPQASYPCGNFSDTSCREYRGSKGSVGPGFPVSIHTENQNQGGFCPSAQRTDFCSAWATLRTPALLFNRCAAPAKLPTWNCSELKSRIQRPCGVKFRLMLEKVVAHIPLITQWAKYRPKYWYFKIGLPLPVMLHLWRHSAISN